MGERLSGVSETVLSPLGAVSVSITGRPGATIQVAKPDIPELSEGMAVDGVTLIRIDISAPVIPEFPVLLQVTAYQDGDAETGEWLDSMAFISPEGVLQVAVHDSDWLAVNGIVADPVQYEPRGFKQTITKSGVGTTLYVSLAWRLADGDALADDASTWFAADLALPENRVGTDPQGRDYSEPTERRAE